MIRLLLLDNYGKDRIMRINKHKGHAERERIEAELDKLPSE